MNMAQQENQVVPFYFSKNRVRIHTDTDGNPWFVAKDVLLALGYQWKGIANLKHVPEEWRGVTSVQTPSGTQEMLMLSEQGLYFFLGRSDKPKALPFQKWLAGDVLPALRKTGRYETPHTTQENPTGPEEETFGDDRLFSPAVLQLESSQRIRLLEQATSMAKEEGWGVHEMEEYFVRLCTMTGKTKRDPKRERIQRFIAQCMTRIPGQNLPFMRVYAAFYEWWEANERGPVPGSKSLATELRRYFEPQKSNVSKYRDCALR